LKHVKPKRTSTEAKLGGEVREPSAFRAMKRRKPAEPALANSESKSLEQGAAEEKRAHVSIEVHSETEKEAALGPTTDGGSGKETFSSSYTEDEEDEEKRKEEEANLGANVESKPAPPLAIKPTF
jgi:hypothetical protein